MQDERGISEGAAPYRCRMGAWRWLAGACLLVAVSACSAPSVDDDLSPAEVRERVGLDALVVAAALRVAGLPVDEARGGFEPCDEDGQVQYVATVTVTGDAVTAADRRQALARATDALETEGWVRTPGGGLLREPTRITLDASGDTLTARLTDTCVTGDMTTDVDELADDDVIVLG